MRCLFVFGCQYQCNWLPRKTCLWNDLLCVKWNVKPYNPPTVFEGLSLSAACTTVCCLQSVSVCTTMTDELPAPSGWKTMISTVSWGECFHCHLCQRCHQQSVVMGGHQSKFGSVDTTLQCGLFIIRGCSHAYLFDDAFHHCADLQHTDIVQSGKGLA